MWTICDIMLKIENNMNQTQRRTMGRKWANIVAKENCRR